MVSINDHPPPNVALCGGVLMVVLRRKLPAFFSYDFAMTSHAAINA